jgi:hypothetical protein
LGKEINPFSFLIGGEKEEVFKVLKGDNSFLIIGG